MTANLRKLVRICLKSGSCIFFLRSMRDGRMDWISFGRTHDELCQILYKSVTSFIALWSMSDELAQFWNYEPHTWSMLNLRAMNVINFRPMSADELEQLWTRGRWPLSNFYLWATNCCVFVGHLLVISWLNVVGALVMCWLHCLFFVGYVLISC